jgi:hypothetical protein
MARAVTVSVSRVLMRPARAAPHDGLRLVDADRDPDDVRYASELVR